ncbi:MAG: VanZ family protein [Clostridia bacterium]|nr:VanZ family protein [Clostridium sp.]
MQKNVLRGILIVLLLCTFYIIFGFSSQDGEKSGGISKRITDFILEKSSKYNSLEISEQEQVNKRTERVIRKIAHFSIYTLVGFLVMALLSTYENIKRKNQIYISTMLGILYAISDEIHQSFTPGRGPKITDVFIDSLGVFFGIIVILLIVEIINIKNKKVSKNVII